MRHSLSLLLLLVLATVSAARAEEGSPLARLAPPERAVLERRIPGLEAMSHEKQELLVRNVERLRSLDAGHRDLIVRRMRDAREAHLGAEELDERRRSLKNLGGDKAQLAEWQGLGMKALGLAAWRDLPATLREHPALRGLARHEFMLAFHRRFWSHAVESLDVREAAAFAVPEGLPAPWRARLARVRAAHEAAPQDPKASRALRDAVLQGRTMLAVRESLATPVAGVEPVTGPESRLLRLGVALRGVAPAAYDSALTTLVRLGEEKGPERLAEELRELARPPQPPADIQQRLDAVRLVTALELLHEILLRQPALATKADALLRAALVDGLGVAAADADALPGRGSEERAPRLRALIEARIPQGEWRRDALRRFGPRGAGGVGPAGGGGGPGRGHRDR